MPGNGVGDRAHNSFDQENLSQGQQHFKATDKNWPGLSNDIWVGSQTQNGFPLGSNLKNYNLPQSANIDGGHGIPSFQVANGLNSVQPYLRSELAGSQFQNQPAAFNGFIQGHSAGRQYEANFLGLDANSYQNTVTSKGLSLLESHHGHAPELQKKDFARFPHVQQTPVSFNSVGGQEQMGGQHPGPLQSLQRQQSGINDVQLLHQQMILRQLHDSQRQQFQHQGVWHQNSPINLLSSMANQATANHSPALLNGIPVHDSPNKSWPELLANNPNRPHLGASAIMQGSPGGFELPSEQSQALRNMGLALQQSDQSLYGVPMAGARDNMSQTSHTQNEMSSFGNSFLRNQHAAPADHANKDRHLVSQQEFSGKQELSGFSDSKQVKTSSTATHPQNVATLDPAEEKILFGSDDNLWEAFGGEMGTGVGGLNMSDGSGLFPSLQSGSWSALMQSALAETSSVETGQQEEWTGLSYPSTEPTTGPQQSSAFNGGPKHDQQPSWTESSVRAGSSFPVAAGHQLDRKVSQERREDLRTDSSPRYMQDSSQGNRHLEPSPLAKSTTEGSQIFGRVDNSSMVDRKQYTSGSWTHQQSMSSFDARAQLNDRSNGWNMIESGVSGEAPSLKSHSSEMFVQPSHDSTHIRQAQEFHGATTGRTDSFHGLTVGSEQSKPLGGTMLQRQDSSSSNATVNPNSSRVVPESTHWLQDSQRFNFWKQIDPSGNSRGSDGLGKTHHVDNNDSKMMESSGNDDMREMHNSRKRENSSGSFPSNVSRHGSPGLVQENSTDGSDYRSLQGSKGNSSGRAVQKPVGLPKFQYHPMGDLDADVDNSLGSKAGASPQTAFQQGFNKFSSIGGSGGSLSMNKSAQPSQNMLELLHKLDQSKESDAASHMSSSDRNDAHEAETSDGSVGQLQRNQSPRSQGFGLQLAPPSQRLQHPDRAVGSQSSSQIPNSRISSDRSEFSNMPFVSAPSNRPLSSWKEKSVGENRNQISGASEQDDVRSSMGFNSGFPFSRSHPENQRDAGRALPGQAFNSALHRLASHSKAKETLSEGIQSTQSPAAPDFSASTSLGSNVSATERVQTEPPVYTGSLPQHSQVSDAAAMGSPSLAAGVPQQGVFSRGLSSSFLGSSSPSLMRPSVQSNDNNLQRGVSGALEFSSSVSFNPPESPRAAEAAQNSLRGKVSSANHDPDASLPGSLSNSTQSQQNYSLLHQMQAMKSLEVDPSDRILKRFRTLESGVDSQAVRMGENQVSHGHSAAAGDVSVVNPFASGDSNAFNLSGKQSYNWNASPASLQMDASRSGSAHSSWNYEGPFRHDNTQVHPQMAPSWVGQSGTLKEDQVLQVPDAQKMAAVKHMEQVHVEKPGDSLRDHEQFHADSDASPVNSSYSWLPASVRAEDISSQHTLPPEAADQSLLMKQKKRKIPVPEVQAWHKEVMNSGRLHSASTTEIEWARAANRLIQKIEDETEEDGLTSLRPKKRLILSTHLMQQLLRPPPAPFLAGDAKSHYENVTYCVSKSALGDACRAVHFSSNKPSVPDSSDKTSLEKPKNPERSGSEEIVKVVEDLLGRANKLEKDLLRLDQRSSMVDLRVELQDLERFSIINRFAKFHGRSPSDVNGGPSSDPTAHASRPLLQRYVMALPMPRNLPDSVQCLSL